MRPIAHRFLPLVLIALAVACTDEARDLPLAPTDPLLAAGPKGEIPSSNGFRKNLTVEAIRAHQAALQAIADANGGTRYSVSAGYAASAAYVQQAMIAAGYQVSVQTFQVNFAGDRTPPVLTQTSPSPRNYVHRVEFQTMSQSGSGDVTAPVTTVDFTANPPADNTTNSGCEAGDFAGFTPGHIALVQRGTCQFSLKVANALAAGAAAVIIMNEGSPARRGLISGTLGAPQPIPVVEATYDIGAQLVSTPGLIMRVRVDYLNGAFDSYNVIAESPLGNANDVVVVGAPLDSDTQGPGINTASGSAALMEIARVFADERKPRNRMRFIWFGGFLQGMVGSQAYLASLAPADVARIRSMVLLPQIASPNFVRFVFDGDNSTFPADALVIAGPPGSGEIERLFTDYFGGSGIASAPIGLNGAADYRAFAQAGIPVGGIFSGSFGIKTAQEQSVFGGVAGIAYDPCFNLACDTYANVSTQALDEMSDAAAHVTLLLSRKNFAKSP